MNGLVKLRLGSTRTTVHDLQNKQVKVKEENECNLKPRFRVCRVCQTAESNYTCPRCNVPYCNLQCYKSHGNQCTEAFFQSHVSQTLELEKKAVESGEGMADKNKMAQILQRVYQNPELTQEEAQELFNDDEALERLESLALSDNLNIDHLSEADRKTFMQQLNSGKLTRLVEVWQPWWELSLTKYSELTSRLRKKQSTTLIQVLSEENQVLETQVTALQVPVYLLRTCPRDIPEFQTLCRKKPSKLLIKNLVDIVYSYVTVLRRYNGDWSDEPLDAAEDVLSLSNVLSGSVPTAHESISQAIAACDTNRELMDSPPLHEVILSDLKSIFSSHVFVTDALADLHAMILLAIESCGVPSVLKILRLVEKKMVFYMSYYHNAITEKKDGVMNKAVVKSLCYIN